MSEEERVAVRISIPFPHILLARDASHRPPFPILGQARRELLFKILISTFGSEAASDTEKSIIIIEDAHNMDTESWKLLIDIQVTPMEGGRSLAFLKGGRKTRANPPPFN